MNLAGPLAGIAAAAIDAPSAVMPRAVSRFEYHSDPRFGETTLDESESWTDLDVAATDDDEFTAVARLLRSFGGDTLSLPSETDDGEPVWPADNAEIRSNDHPTARSRATRDHAGRGASPSAVHERSADPQGPVEAAHDEHSSLAQTRGARLESDRAASSSTHAGALEGSHASRDPSAQPQAGSVGPARDAAHAALRLDHSTSLAAEPERSSHDGMESESVASHTATVDAQEVPSTEPRPFRSSDPRDPSSQSPYFSGAQHELDEPAASAHDEASLSPSPDRAVSPSAEPYRSSRALSGTARFGTFGANVDTPGALTSHASDDASSHELRKRSGVPPPLADSTAAAHSEEPVLHTSADTSETSRARPAVPPAGEPRRSLHDRTEAARAASVAAETGARETAPSPDLRDPSTQSSRPPRQLEESAGEPRLHIDPAASTAEPAALAHGEASLSTTPDHAVSSIAESRRSSRVPSETARLASFGPNVDAPEALMSHASRDPSSHELDEPSGKPPLDADGSAAAAFLEEPVPHSSADTSETPRTHPAVPLAGEPRSSHDRTEAARAATFAAETGGRGPNVDTPEALRSHPSRDASSRQLGEEPVPQTSADTSETARARPAVPPAGEPRSSHDRTEAARAAAFAVETGAPETTPSPDLRDPSTQSSLKPRGLDESSGGPQRLSRRTAAADGAGLFAPARDEASFPSTSERAISPRAGLHRSSRDPSETDRVTSFGAQVDDAAEGPAPTAPRDTSAREFSERPQTVPPHADRNAARAFSGEPIVGPSDDKSETPRAHPAAPRAGEQHRSSHERSDATRIESFAVDADAEATRGLPRVAQTDTAGGVDAAPPAPTRVAQVAETDENERSRSPRPDAAGAAPAGPVAPTPDGASPAALVNRALPRAGEPHRFAEHFVEESSPHVTRGPDDQGGASPFPAHPETVAAVRPMQAARLPAPDEAALSPRLDRGAAAHTDDAALSRARSHRSARDVSETAHVAPFAADAEPRETLHSPDPRESSPRPTRASGESGEAASFPADRDTVAAVPPVPAATVPTPDEAALSQRLARDAVAHTDDAALPRARPHRSARDVSETAHVAPFAADAEPRETLHSPDPPESSLRSTRASGERREAASFPADRDTVAAVPPVPAATVLVPDEATLSLRLDPSHRSARDVSETAHFAPLAADAEPRETLHSTDPPESSPRSTPASGEWGEAASFPADRDTVAAVPPVPAATVLVPDEATLSLRLAWDAVAHTDDAGLARARPHRSARDVSETAHVAPFAADAEPREALHPADPRESSPRSTLASGEPAEAASFPADRDIVAAGPPVPGATVPTPDEEALSLRLARDAAVHSDDAVLSRAGSHRSARDVSETAHVTPFAADTSARETLHFPDPRESSTRASAELLGAAPFSADPDTVAAIPPVRAATVTTPDEAGFSRAPDRNAAAHVDDAGLLRVRSAAPDDAPPARRMDDTIRSGKEPHRAARDVSETARVASFLADAEVLETSRSLEIRESSSPAPGKPAGGPSFLARRKALGASSPAAAPAAPNEAPSSLGLDRDAAAAAEPIRSSRSPVAPTRVAPGADETPRAAPFPADAEVLETSRALDLRDSSSRASAKPSGGPTFLAQPTTLGVGSPAADAPTPEEAPQALRLDRDAAADAGPKGASHSSAATLRVGRGQTAAAHAPSRWSQPDAAGVLPAASAAPAPYEASPDVSETARVASFAVNAGEQQPSRREFDEPSVVLPLAALNAALEFPAEPDAPLRDEATIAIRDDRSVRGRPREAPSRAEHAAVSAPAAAARSAFDPIATPADNARQTAFPSTETTVRPAEESSRPASLPSSTAHADIVLAVEDRAMEPHAGDVGGADVAGPIRSAAFAEHHAIGPSAIAWGDVLDAANVRDAVERRIPQPSSVGAAVPPPRTVRIAIDRIELVAPPEPPAPPRRAEPTITLDRYAERRR